MNLKEALELSQSTINLQKQEITEERLRAILPDLRNVVAYWREYPDMLVDYLRGDNPKNFNLFFYQRMFLRAAMRYRNFYAVYPRAYSKSFLSIMVLMLRAVLYPGAQLFITSAGKEQSASITKEKVTQICDFLPGMKNEIDWDHKKEGRDMVFYPFKNGSSISIVAMKQSTRGRRKTAGLIEESASLSDDDAKTLQEVVVPLMNVSRILPDGSKDDDEVQNKSLLFITTAGYKNTFAYDKLIQTMIMSLLKPDENYILGGTYRVPVMEGLLDKNFVNDLKLDGTYNEDSFSREYESKWSGDSEAAFFSASLFDKYRELLQAEQEYSGRSTKDAYYIVAVDVGRFKCTTEAVILKVTPQPMGSAIKSLVNLFTYEAEDFEQQAINIKKLFYRYKARTVVIDANGVGAGLVDFMTKVQIDPETGDSLPAFGVENDDDGNYKTINKAPGVVTDAMYLIKANVPINSEGHSYVKTQMYSGKVKFLIDERTAKSKFLATKRGANASLDARNEYLKPYTLTSILREQMLNLSSDNQGENVILKQVSRGIPKDKYSAFQYGMYYIKKQEESIKKRKRFSVADLMLMN